ncbi:unnamed protein product [Rotaria magnacalcarata]|nr:unnamed protein product [Rotaria magnacalcarata]
MCLAHLLHTYNVLAGDKLRQAPTYVHKKLQEYQLKDEYNPDRWFRLDAQVAMEKLRQKVLSKYVNCDPDDLVILDNVSTAINSILKSLKLCYIIMLHT